MRKTGLALYALFLAVFLVLSYLASQNYLFTGEAAASRWLQEIDSSLFHATMMRLTFFGNTIPAAVITALGVVWLLFVKKRLEAVFIAALVSMASLAGWALKLIVARPRPPDSMEAAGFPSLHTLFAMTFYGSLFYLVPRLIKSPVLVTIVRWGLALVILLTGLSRVYLGEHWPADVLGSLILGGLLLAPAIALYERRAKQPQ